MDKIVIGMLGLGILIAGLAGAAFLFAKRSQTPRAATTQPPEPGPVGRSLQRLLRVLVVVMGISTLAVLLLGVIKLIWFILGCVVAYVVLDQIYRSVRSTGK